MITRQRWKIISLVCSLQCWASAWRSSSHGVDCSQLSDRRQHSSHFDSSTFCPHYRVLQCLFLGTSVHMTISEQDLHVAFKLPFCLQNTITIEKFGQDFIGLEEILNFLPRKKYFTDTKHNQVGSESGNYFPQYVCYPPCLLWKGSANCSPGGKNSHPPGS